MPIIGAGVAFFAFLALFPALIATISLYGLVASPETVSRQIQSLSTSCRRGPDAAQRPAEQHRRQQQRRADGQPDHLHRRGAVERGRRHGNLITAVNLAYDEVETRGFVKRKLLALG